MVKGYEVEEEKRGIKGYPSEERGPIKGYDFKPPSGPLKPVPLRDWEFTLATGEWLGPKGDLTGGGFFETIYDPTATRPISANVYAGVRTAAEILPYARYIFPSGRDEWARKTTTGQTVELGIEALTILPIGLIGKGLKVTAKAVTKVGAFPFKATKKFALKKRTGKLLEQDPFLDIASTSMKKFERLGAAEKAVKKYNISGEEATSLLRRRPWIWERSERSGASFQTEGSTNFRKLFKKDGYLQRDVAEQLGRWSRPQAEQELGHYNAEWMKLVKKTFGLKYDVENIFKMQAVKLFGEEVGKTLKLGDVDTNTFGLLIRDLLEENPAKLMGRMDIGYGHVMPYHTIPARKVFGLGDRVWNTYSKIYEPVGRMFTNANKYGTLMTSKFHSLLASRGLGRLTAPREAGVVMLKKNFSKREWEQAGELVTSLDNAVGKGVKQEELQAIMDNAPTVVQKIAKSWFDFTDDLYGDYMKKKLPQVFEEIGLTGRGRDGLALLMKGEKGIDNIVDVTLSQSANLAYADKAKILGAMLEKARRSLKGNLNWFTDKPLNTLTKAEGEELRNRLLGGLEQLLPMKKGSTKGFVNYLDKYATRIYEKQFAQSTKRSAELAKSRKAMFTKERTREFAEEGQITDLTRIAEARINMQAKELYVYKPLEEVIDHARKLPEKFRNYSEHYIARQLGEASNADLALAQWLTGTVGRLTRTVYDERSVAQLAHTINDLVYMGGLGFKPFSAMRNYFQPLLMVPADLGGVKDFYWLGKGYSAAFKKPTRDYIKSIGAIQEFAPDLYLRPRVIGFGGSFTVGGKKFNLPSTQTMRDLALWMFKNSDRHNRYVTGGAAIAKWDYFTSKYLSKSLGKKEMKQFTKKLNVGSREEWIRAKINEHLRAGTLEGLEEAKKIWVYDVIADTQYLYGTLDAPIYGQSAGSLGKMAGIFQSWWMNYGTALEKWALRTPGSAPIVNKRMMTWLLAGAIVEETASKLWQQKTAAKMVHVGPFPLRVSEFMIPPTFAPVYYAAKTLADGIDAVKYQEPERFKRSVKALAKSGLMFTPGGLQMSQLYRGAKKEGWPGLAKAIVRYDPEREEEY